MTDLLQLDQYLKHCVENIKALKTPFLVIDDSQINIIMKDLKATENLVLLGVVPSHATSGSQDAVRSADTMSFLVLKKVSRDIKHSEFIQNLHLCQETANQLRRKLIMDMEDYNDGCSFLTQLEVGSIKLDPVWNLAGCDGYEIHFRTFARMV